MNQFAKNSAQPNIFQIISVFSCTAGYLANKQYNQPHPYRCIYHKHQAGSSASRHTFYPVGFPLPYNFPSGKME